LVVLGKVWAGAYVDSIRLMQVADALRRLPGVSAVELLMATEANRRALAGSGLWPSGFDAAGATDLVLAVRAAGEAPARVVLDAAERLLAERRRPDEAPTDEPCRSIMSAVRRDSGARFAVVSVPGPFVANEAHQALTAGLHVFVFSDGVTLEDEVRLKRRAADAGLLVMGPECGTAIVDGVGIGFANRVRRGPVGLVGASGTGLQEVTCLLHRLGSGVSHAIGTGGRDLHARVGGLTTQEALGSLARDPDTQVIALVSKPASPAVVERVLAAASATGKPVVACLLGWRGAVSVR
jgi:FdrA protein